MKIVINISKDNDMLGSYDENSLREIILSEEVINEFKLKYDVLGYERNLEEFISRDISDLIKNEIDNGLYGLFNY
tara:strand:+ start:78 stop:302 length:225 start_codon:yes stop_codon:yes gene_type:complete